MYDWIIGADIYRLNKAARDASSPHERRQIEKLVEVKTAFLAAGDRQTSRRSAS